MFAGTSTIEVRISEQTKTANTSQTDAENANDDTEMKTENMDQVLNESLDNQIIDLLSAIREEEESKISEDNTDDEVEFIENESTKMKTENETTEMKTKTENAEAKNETNGEAGVQEEIVENKNKDTVKNEVKETGRATPTRASARIATSTPSSVRTRRASKLAQN